VVHTLVRRDVAYTMPAPRVVKGKVIIGSSGAEYGVRGYVSAYDAATGALAWRFFTVPGDPALGFESETLANAAKTWNGEWWKLGGGGTVWDSMAYDPELDLLFIGTGNGSPWNQALRSPGGGDNLFLSSIVALRPDDGSYVWHYQTTPGESWDYTATQPIVVADLAIDGARRRVVMEAPKNGFFYVLDAATGKLLSADKFAAVNWASGVDLATGRPIENPAARYYPTGKPAALQPSSGGAHNWHRWRTARRRASCTSRRATTRSRTRRSQLHAEPARDEPRHRSRRERRGGRRARRAAAGLAHGGVGSRGAAREVARRRTVRGMLATAGGLVLGGKGNVLAAYAADDGRQL
jgi:PQQ-dependent dehydrogenase (methanol/ethanol family)